MTLRNHRTIVTVDSVNKSQSSSSRGRREEDISKCGPRFKNSDVLGEPGREISEG